MALNPKISVLTDKDRETGRGCVKTEAQIGLVSVSQAIPGATEAGRSKKGASRGNVTV